MKRSILRRGFHSFAAMALVLVLCGSGCGRAGKSFSPAGGQVLLGDLPAAGVTLTFIPVNAPADARPYGEAGPDGRYTLKTFDSKTHKVRPGAPPGEYVVLLSWVGLVSQPQGAVETERLDARYGDPGTSPLRAIVKRGPTELETIQLSEYDVQR